LERRWSAVFGDEVVVESSFGSYGFGFVMDAVSALGIITPRSRQALAPFQNSLTRVVLTGRTPL
jgi:hypothetical protein